MGISGINKVLSILMCDINISESELARRIKIPAATLNKLKTGRVVDPKASTLQLIASYFAITIDQLLGYAPLSMIKPQTLRYVPIIESNQLVSLNLNKLNYSNHKQWMSFENKQRSRTNLFAINLISDAMYPYFDEKATVIVELDRVFNNKDYVIVYLNKTKEVILRQVFLDGSDLILKPINDMFKTVILGTKDKIIGVVIHSIQSFE